MRVWRLEGDGAQTGEPGSGPRSDCGFGLPPSQGRQIHPKPPKATTKPYTRHILGIDSGVQSHPKATPRPPQSHILGSTEAPPCDPQAASKPPTCDLQAKYTREGSHVRSYSLRVLFVFSWCSHGILLVFCTYFSVVPSAVPRRLHRVIAGSIRSDLRWGWYSGGLIATIICLEIVRNID